MSLEMWLALGRDFAGVLLLASALLLSAAFFSGSLGALAASCAVIAVGGLAALGLFGVLSAATPLPSGAILLIVALIAAGGAFYAAQSYGVRGLWVGALLGLGVVFAAALVWAIGQRLMAPIGPAAPILAFALMALFAFAALGAAARVVPSAGAGAAANRDLAGQANWALATPPAWFDCAYATLGGRAARPGECRFTPPTVAAAPELVGAVGDAASAGVAARSSEDLAAAPPPRAAAPGPLEEPSPPAAQTPTFETALGQENVPPETPEDLGAPENADRAVSAPSSTPAGEEAGAPPRTAGAPETPAAPISASDAAEISVASIQGPAPATVDAAAPAGAAPEPADALRPPEPPSPDLDRPRTAFVCFPMTSFAADRLCPDQEFGVEDLGVAWRMPGGEAVGAPDGVHCAVDPDIGLHATLMVNLSGHMAEPFGGGGSKRKADALYDAATRLVGLARGDAEGGAPTQMSLYIAGGSSLLSPWAEQSFAPGRADRLYDLGSSGQALALLRRLKAGALELRPGAPAADLLAAAAAMAAERPSADGAEAMSRSVSAVLLVTDAQAVAEVPEAAAAEAGAALASAGLPTMVVEFGAGAPSPAMTRLADASGGSAVAAEDAEALHAALRDALTRMRRFCAVRVTAPERFFTDGVIELTLRRRMRDGCSMEQVASISCEGLRLRERIDPNEP